MMVIMLTATLRADQLQMMARGYLQTGTWCRMSSRAGAGSDVFLLSVRERVTCALLKG